MSTLSYVLPDNTEFPARLVGASPAPDGIWVRANAALSGILSAPTVGIVGARDCSDYGAHVARTFARDLARAGVVIVSGMARGIDGYAHRGAIEGDGKTVAVLGCGIDRDYPSIHRDLAEQIVATGGAVMSEYEPGIRPDPRQFMERNRIVAALSDILVVVEARKDSGSMNTANRALHQGIPIRVVPGRITSPLSDGPNWLLTSVVGVEAVLDSEQILDALATQGRLFT